MLTISISSRPDSSDGAQNVAADPSEPVDGDLYGHEKAPLALSFPITDSLPGDEWRDEPVVTAGRSLSNSAYRRHAGLSSRRFRRVGQSRLKRMRGTSGCISAFGFRTVGRPARQQRFSRPPIDLTGAFFDVRVVERAPGH